MSEEKNMEEEPENQASPLNDLEHPRTADNPDMDISQASLAENDQQKIETTEPAKEHLPSTAIEDNRQERETLHAPTENMEVHHHPHVHHSKKWKNYLYEFLMLFLAVTAGFFVENRRESYIEHHRANQFSRQLLADLRLDSLMFENRNRDINNLQHGYDRLLYLLTEKSYATDKEILETLLPITFVFDITATSTTYNQMKTSGSLRYIENRDLTADLQQYYDVLLPRSIKLAEASLAYFSQNINPFYLKHIRVQDFDSFNDTLINKNPVILDRSTQTNQELANIMGGYRSLLKIQLISMNEPALKKIKETLVILKKVYNLR